MLRTENFGRRLRVQCSAVGVLFMLFASTSRAGIHTWDVLEVFSNADGTIQYVELVDNGAGGGETGVGNGSLSSSLHSFSWSNGPVTGPTNGRKYLVATAGFAALPGAPVPDVIIPPANVPFFNVAGDTVAFGGFDSLVFGAVPTNGTDSFDELTGVGSNTPTNYAGTSGTVDASGGPQAVPMSSTPIVLLIGALLIGTGVYAERRSRLAGA